MHRRSRLPGLESVAPVKPTVTVAWMGGKDCRERHLAAPSATTATTALLVLASVLSAVCGKIY